MRVAVAPESKGVPLRSVVWHLGGVDDRQRDLNATAKAQRGLFTRAQVLAAGFPESTIGGRVSRGLYEAVHPGVYGLSGSDNSWHRRVLAGTLSATFPAAASHRAAAYLWGMTSDRRDDFEVTTRRHLRCARPTFTVHESKDLLESDVVEVDGIPVTIPERTIVDLGASAPPWFVERCLDSGLRQGLFTARRVRSFIARVARPGRTGVGTIRPLIEDRLVWSGVTESVLEDLFRSVIGQLPYALPELQFKLFTPNGGFVGRYDFAYPSRMALIETDSERWHMDSVSFQRDREKQNRAHALGWTVYRFTWRQLTEDPGSVRRIITAIWTGPPTDSGANPARMRDQLAPEANRQLPTDSGANPARMRDS